MQVIGVVDDFNYRSLHRQVDPLGMFIVPTAARYLSLRMTSDQIMASMGELEAMWERAGPQSPVLMHFLSMKSSTSNTGQSSDFAVLV